MPKQGFKGFNLRAVSFKEYDLSTLGFEEFNLRKTEDSIRKDPARVVFLKAVRIVAPQAMIELRDGPFAMCCNIASPGKPVKLDPSFPNPQPHPLEIQKPSNIREAVLQSLQDDQSKQSSIRLGSSSARRSKTLGESQSLKDLTIFLNSCDPSSHAPRSNVCQYDDVSLNLMDVIDPNGELEGRVFDLEPIRESFFEWLQKWHLDAEWCRDQALLTMRWWRVDNDALERLELYLRRPLSLANTLSYKICAYSGMISADSGRNIEIPSIPEGFPIWQITLVPRKTYLNSIEKAVRGELEKSPLLKHLPPKLRLDCVEAIRKKASEYDFGNLIWLLSAT